MSPRPPKTVAEWVRYLHTARAVPKDSPDYGQAQEAVRFALQRIRTLNAEANAQEQAAAEGGKPVSTPAAAGVGLLHGLSLGAGEPLAGALAALIPGGQGFREGAAEYRQGLENVGLQHPVATPTGEVGGLALQSLAPVGQAIRGGSQAAAAIPAGRAGVLARFFTGAGQANVAPAMTMGGIAGFSQGGEDPGDLGTRLQNAAVGAGVGAAGAAALGGLGALRVPRWLNGVKRTIRQSLPKNTPPDVVEGMTESGIRAQLRREGYPPESHDRIVAAWRAGKTEVPPAPPPPTVRPGETIAPIDPLETPTFQRRGTGRGLPTQMGGPVTVPRGVGGHSYTGTYPAGTAAGLPQGVPSPVNPGAQAMQLQQLQMLAQLPNAEFEQVAGLFPKELVDQLRAVRFQFGLGQ